jgi:hypothetical protein
MTVQIEKNALLLNILPVTHAFPWQGTFCGGAKHCAVIAYVKKVARQPPWRATMLAGNF